MEQQILPELYFGSGDTADEEALYVVLRAMLSCALPGFYMAVMGKPGYPCKRGVLGAWTDYKHGTGHGVGNIPECAEGPQSFRWKLLPDAESRAVFEEGRITSDEPGIYLENSNELD